MAKKKASKKFTTARSDLLYVFITGFGRQNKKQKKLGKAGKYQAALRIPSDDPWLKQFKKEIRDFWEEHKPKDVDICKSNGIKPEYKKDEDGKATKEETGFTLINAWTGASYEDSGDAVEVPIYNSKGRKTTTNGKLIGEGTTGRILGTMKVYETDEGDAGVTLYLNGLQIKKFVEYIDQNAPDAEDDSDGDDWDGEEDDYSADADDSADGDDDIPF